MSHFLKRSVLFHLHKMRLFSLDFRTGEVKEFQKRPLLDYVIMGYIKEDIEIIGSRKNKRVNAMFDSGAFSNYIRSTFDDGETPDDIGFPIFEGETSLICANGSTSPAGVIRFDKIRINKFVVNQPRFVMTDTLLFEVIIGAELMQMLGIVLDPKNEKIINSDGS